MYHPERDAHLVLEEIATIHGRVHKRIRVRELAASHKLEKMRRVQMLKQRPTWTREIGLDRIETIAEMHEETLRRLPADFDPEPVYAGFYSARRPHTPEEFTLDMKVEVKGLSMGLLLSEPPPPEYDLPPRVRRLLMQSPSDIPPCSSPLPSTES